LSTTPSPATRAPRQSTSGRSKRAGVADEQPKPKKTGAAAFEEQKAAIAARNEAVRKSGREALKAQDDLRERARLAAKKKKNS